MIDGTVSGSAFTLIINPFEQIHTLAAYQIITIVGLLHLVDRGGSGGVYLLPESLTALHSRL